MSDPRSCWGPLSIQIQLKIHICVVLWGSTPSLAPVTSMSHLQIMWCVGGSTLYLDPAPDPYFYRWSFGIPTTLCYLQNWMFCPITPFQVVTIQIFIHKLGLFLPDNHFEDLQPYVIFKPECFVSELCSTLSDLKNSITNKGPFFEAIVLSTKITILSSKLSILSHNPAPDAYLCCTFAGSIPSLASVPSISHL